MLEIPCEMHYFKQNREKVFNFNDHASLFFMQLHTLHVNQNEIFTISELLNLNFQSLLSFHLQKSINIFYNSVDILIILT